MRPLARSSRTALSLPNTIRLDWAGRRRDGGSVKQQLDERDTAFGDYRTRRE